MTTTGHRTLCTALRNDGLPCQAWAVDGSEFCLSHAPERRAQMAIARRNGGKARHGRRIGPTGDAQSVKLTGPEDVLRVIEDELNELLRMERSISRARAVGYLLSVFTQVYESSELEQRLQALEQERDNANTGV